MCGAFIGGHDGMEPRIFFPFLSFNSLLPSLFLFFLFPIYIYIYIYKYDIYRYGTKRSD